MHNFLAVLSRQYKPMRSYALRFDAGAERNLYVCMASVFRLSDVPLPCFMQLQLAMKAQEWSNQEAEKRSKDQETITQLQQKLQEEQHAAKKARQALKSAQHELAAARQARRDPHTQSAQEAALRQAQQALARKNEELAMLREWGRRRALLRDVAEGWCPGCAGYPGCPESIGS
jgi:hypothetical protein